MTELITMHTHSTFCGHAHDSLESMVEAAVRAGVSVMAATEHFPMSDVFDSAHHASMRAENLEAYKAEVHRLQQAHPEITLLLGCELDYLGPEEDRSITLSDLEDFDIVLGSVHFLGTWLLNSTRFEHLWREADADAVWLQYIDRWCEAAQSSMPFTVMAHPDVIKKFRYYPSFDLAPHYERMAQAAAAGGRMIEVNTSGKFCPCAQYYPAPELLQAFCRAGVACTVGTDAHRAGHVARDIEAAYDYMRAAGYKCVTVPRAHGAYEEIPLS